jgi:hypothetical protein
VLPFRDMTVLEALAILESAVLECKKRDVNTPEVGAALDLLEPYHPAEMVDFVVPHGAVETAITRLIGKTSSNCFEQSSLESVTQCASS